MTEARELPKSRLVLALIALFLSSMCTLGDLVINPIVANLYEVFADSPEWLINLGITGPALVGLPFGFLAGVLCDRMNKKWVMVIGFAIFVASACCGAMITNIYYFVTLRLLATGVGWGITNTAALAILADLFTDEDEHGKYVGWYNTVMSLLGAGMAAVAGMFAANGTWQSAFQTYLISIPVLIMLIIFLPNFYPKKKAADSQGAGEEAEAVPSGWWTKLIPLTIQVFFVALCYFVMLYMIALFVVDAEAGDEAFIGMLASAGTIACAVGSFLFGFAYKRMKNAVYLPALFIMGACFLAMAFMPSAGVITACVIIAGLFWPFYFCYFYTRCTELAPASRAGTATSIVAVSDGLAAAACSYVLTGLMGAMGANSIQVWPIFGVILIIVGVISCIWYFATLKKNVATA